MEIVADLQNNIWGVNVAKTATNKGVLAASKRLVRSEFHFKASETRQAINVESPYTIGYTIILDSTGSYGVNCRICYNAYGQEKFYYDRDPIYTPPAETHPNCHCTLGPPIFITLAQFRRLHAA